MDQRRSDDSARLPLNPERASWRVRSTRTPSDRKALAETLFETVAVLGIRTMRTTPTRDAVDLEVAEAFGADDVEMFRARGIAPPRLSELDGFLLINCTAPRESSEETG